MRWLTGVVALLVCGTAFAAEEPRYQVAAMGAYVTGGEFENSAGADLDADEATGWSLALNIEQLPGRYYEFIYTDASTEIDGTTPFDIGIQYLQIGGTVSWPDNRYVIPYFGATLGGARFDPDATNLDAKTRVAFSVAGGLKVPITDNIAVRAEVRTYITLLGGEEDLFCVSAGGLTCDFRAESDTFLQHTAQLGVSVGWGR